MESKILTRVEQNGNLKVKGSFIDAKAIAFLILVNGLQPRRQDRAVARPLDAVGVLSGIREAVQCCHEISTFQRAVVVAVIDICNL